MKKFLIVLMLLPETLLGNEALFFLEAEVAPAETSESLYTLDRCREANAALQRLLAEYKLKLPIDWSDIPPNVRDAIWPALEFNIRCFGYHTTGCKKFTWDKTNSIRAKDTKDCRTAYQTCITVVLEGFRCTEPVYKYYELLSAQLCPDPRAFARDPNAARLGIRGVIVCRDVKCFNPSNPLSGQNCSSNQECVDAFLRAKKDLEACCCSECRNYHGHGLRCSEPSNLF